MKIATVAERPDLVESGWTATRDTLPEYNNHGDVLNRYWGRLTEERPEFQFHIGDTAAARPQAPATESDTGIPDWIPYAGSFLAGAALSFGIRRRRATATDVIIERVPDDLRELTKTP